MSTGTLVASGNFVGQPSQLRSESGEKDARWWLASASLAEASTTGTGGNLLQTHVARRRVGGVVRSRVRRSNAEEFKPKVKWLGYVTGLVDDGFTATFQSDEDATRAIVAEFDIDELSPDDRPLLKEGAQLVWAIFSERVRGYIENGSILYIRRIPVPSQAAIEAARRRLDAMFEDLDDEPPGN